MPKTTRNRRAASKGKAARSKGEKKAATKGGPTRGPRAAASTRPECEDEAFTETLIATGQASRLGKDGKLPAGATHKIVEDEAGNVKTVRRRFSIA